MEYNKFKPGDLIERRIDNEYYYKQLKCAPEYGIVMEVIERNQMDQPRQWCHVYWVGDKPIDRWHLVNDRLMKVEE